MYSMNLYCKELMLAMAMLLMISPPDSILAMLIIKTENAYQTDVLIMFHIAIMAMLTLIERGFIFTHAGFFLQQLSRACKRLNNKKI